MNILITGLLFNCAAGALAGSILALSLKWLAGRLMVIVPISGLCALVIGAAYSLCYAVGGAGFIGYVCNLLIVPFCYIGYFMGWDSIYSTIALGMVIQIGFMTVTGWLMWRCIKARKSKTDANQPSDPIVHGKRPNRTT